MTTIPASTMRKVTKNLAGMPELLGILCSARRSRWTRP
jgi:hypothetical protein